MYIIYIIDHAFLALKPQKIKIMKKNFEAMIIKGVNRTPTFDKYERNNLLTSCYRKFYAWWVKKGNYTPKNLHGILRLHTNLQWLQACKIFKRWNFVKELDEKSQNHESSMFSKNIGMQKSTLEKILIIPGRHGFCAFFIAWI